MVHVSSCMLWDTAIQSYHHALTELFNLSLKNAKFSDNWKISNKTPVFKSGDPSSVLNYRPISLLPLISKILERIIHSCLMNFLQTNRLLSSCQYGFRPSEKVKEMEIEMKQLKDKADHYEKKIQELEQQKEEVVRMAVSQEYFLPDTCVEGMYIFQNGRGKYLHHDFNHALHQITLL